MPRSLRHDSHGWKQDPGWNPGAKGAAGVGEWKGWGQHFRPGASTQCHRAPTQLQEHPPVPSVLPLARPYPTQRVGDYVKLNLLPEWEAATWVCNVDDNEQCQKAVPLVEGGTLVGRQQGLTAVPPPREALSSSRDKMVQCHLWVRTRGRYSSEKTEQPLHAGFISPRHLCRQQMGTTPFMHPGVTPMWGSFGKRHLEDLFLTNQQYLMKSGARRTRHDLPQ